MTTQDKILINRLKEILTKKFPDIVSDIIVYGSRITKDKINSDFDLIIITSKKIDWKKQREIKNDIYEFGIESDVVFDPKVFCYTDLNNNFKHLPFFKSIEKTGVYL